MKWNLGHEETTCGIFNETLNINQACLDVVSYFEKPVKLYIKNTQCFECDFVVQGLPVLPNGTTTSFIVDTSFPFESYFYDGKNKYCERRNNFEDFGLYALNISESSCSDIKVVKKPEKLWINIGFLLCIYFAAFILFWLFKFMYKQCKWFLSSSYSSLRELEMDLGNPNALGERKSRVHKHSRVTSIDTFRGVAIMLMIFVNYGGGEYSVFKHTPWNGLTIADLVFPWFVWIMGASIVLSLRSKLRTSTPKKRIFIQICKRTILLIALGIMLNSGKQGNHDSLRICGVLQRLGITYFIVASVELLNAKPQRHEQYGPWYFCQDIIDFWMQWLIVICFTAVHEILTFTLKVPGCPTGYLGPGGLSEHSKFRNCTGGSAGYIDRLLITNSHMYQHGTFVKIYKPPEPYDPEGLLGTLTSVVCAFLGVQAARIVLSVENPYSRIIKWLIWGTCTGIAAGILCNWSENYGIIPVNKNLWSLSYVLAASSIAFFFIAIFYWLVDFTHFWNGFPFTYPGMNAITLYLGHSLLKNQLPWRWKPFTNTHMELLTMDVTATTIWLIVSYTLYKYNVFISL